MEGSINIAPQIRNEIKILYFTLDYYNHKYKIANVTKKSFYRNKIIEIRKKILQLRIKL